MTSLLVIAICGIGFVLLGRYVFKMWFNHVSIYSGIWSLSLLFFELRLIHYYPLESETWLIIISGGMAFILGSLTVAVARAAVNRKVSYEDISGKMSPELLDKEVLLVRNIVLILSGISFLIALQHWYIVIKEFGGIANVLIWGNLVYSFRVSEGLPGSIPYIDSLAISAVLFGGVYTALVGRIRLVSLIPIFVVMFLEVANMGRAKLIMSAIFFFTGYFVRKKYLNLDGIKKKPNWTRQVISVVVFSVILLGGAEFVRSTRRSIETFEGASNTLQKLQGSSFITPSMYMYMTIHHGVLNQYLKQDDEHTPWGSNTFAPIYRMVSKLGFDIYVRTYQRFYRTPTGANTGTYLRELHADFGIFGVVFFPYLLGLIASFYFYRFSDRKLYRDLAFIAYLNVLVAMSLLYGATRAGDLLVGFFGAVILGQMIDKFLFRFKNREILV